MFSNPFRDTCTILESITVSRSHMGLMVFSETRYLQAEKRNTSEMTGFSFQCPEWWEKSAGEKIGYLICSGSAPRGERRKCRLPDMLKSAPRGERRKCWLPDLLRSAPRGERRKCRLPDLLRSAPRGCIGNGPGCFLPGTEFCLLQNLNQHGEDVGIDYCLQMRVKSIKQTGRLKTNIHHNIQILHYICAIIAVCENVYIYKDYIFICHITLLNRHVCNAHIYKRTV